MKLFNLATKGGEDMKLEGHESGVMALGVSADGRTLVSGGYDNKVLIWDANTGKRKLTLEGHTSSVNSVAVSKDGTLVISSSEDYSTRIWKVEGKELKPAMRGCEGF